MVTRSVQLLLIGALLASAAAAQDDSAQSNDEASTPLPPVHTSVTVTGTISTDAPAAVTVLDSDDIRSIPGNNLDDRLRQVPGFSLFRRSSSIVANPTTQGVSLRGTGSSGASRTLILWDSIPINDPFGGWVYWTRIDPNYVDRVEIDRGASTSVFGDRAMGGTISLFSQPEQQEHIWADFFGGNEGTADASAGYSNLWGPWGLSVNSRGFTTDGYYVTPDSVRGRIDDKANVRFATGDVNLDYLGSADRLSVHFDVLAEERHNGTLLTHNSTGLGTIGANYTHSWTNDQVSVLAFHTQEQYHSTYSSVAASRNSETQTSKQTVPEEDVGGAAYWRHHASVWNTIVGADVDDIHGTSYDYSYFRRALTASGGTLLEHGLFGQGDFSIGPARFFGGIRHQFTGERGQTFVSPNGGVSLGLKRFRLRASAYRSFRAPTLNELYRNFQVGNALTLANPALVPEGLVGVETGVDWAGENTHVSISLFRNELNNLVDNATLRVTPNQILRQRTNFPSALSRGVEINLARKWRNFIGEAGYMYADARLGTGQRIPEVPKQQGTAQLTYAAGKTLFSAGIRSFGLVFDDDLNQFKLPGYAAVQATAQRQITKAFWAVASVENLLDRTYLVALTPSPNIGEPRLWRVGVRWSGKIH